MQHQILAVALALTAVLPAAAQDRTPRASDRRTQDIYVGVVDGSGKPVTGLTTTDFTVREDGVAREIVSVGPATEPLTLSLIVDDSQASTDAIQFMRDGLNAFLDKLSGKGDIAIATVGERPTIQIDYTPNTEALKKAAGRLFQKSGSGAYLLDGLVDVSKGLQKREAKRPTIVVITTEAGVEFSNRAYQQVLDDLQKSGATLHVLALGQPAASIDDAMRNRNIVIAEGTARSGGRRDQILANSGLSDRMKQLADEIVNQYVVTYGRPDQLIPPEKVQVTVNRQGLTARAKTRAAER
jgi:VWFA-related protein